jgi:hypothetical protein
MKHSRSTFILVAATVAVGAVVTLTAHRPRRADKADQTHADQADADQTDADTCERSFAERRLHGARPATRFAGLVGLPEPSRRCWPLPASGAVFLIPRLVRGGCLPDG